MNNIFTSIRSLVLCLFICGIFHGSSAQQIAIFNQNIYNPEFYNPATLGDGFIGIQYRNQFSDLDSKDAPRSFSINTDLSTLLNLSDKKIGLGLSVFSEKAHIINRLKGKLSFAYHLIKNENNTLSTGIEAGLLSQRIDFSNTRISNPQDLLIYDGESKKMVFDGGFGVRYQYSSDSGQEFNFNLSMPQLFTSNLNYDTDHEFETNPHLLAGASYRIPFGNSAIEPHLFYRDIIGEKSIKKGKIDLSLRGHFLNDRFWIGAGTRLKASSYNLSLGVQAVENLKVQGTFETHNELGNTWEILLVYNFGKSTPPPPPTPGNDLSSRFQKLEQTSNQSHKEVREQMKDAKEQFQITKNYVELAKREGLSKEAVTFNLKKATSSLENTKVSIEKTLNPARLTRNNKTEAKDLYIKARNEKNSNRKIDNSWVNIQDYEDKSVKSVGDLVRSYQQLQRDINNLKSRNKIDAIEIKSLVANKDVVKLQSHYEQAFNNEIGIPKNVKPVKVTTDGNTLKLSYQYPHGKNEFKLEGGLSEPRFILDHVAQQIKTLKSKNISIKSITVVANMQSSNSTLESTTLNTFYREEHFGFRINLNYNFIDEANKTMNSKSTLVEPGKINLKQLACLKMYGIERYLIKNGISAATHPISFQMSAPNYEQNVPQEYAIIIEFK